MITVTQITQIKKTRIITIKHTSSIDREAKKDDDGQTGTGDDK